MLFSELKCKDVINIKSATWNSTPAAAVSVRLWYRAAINFWDS